MQYEALGWLMGGMGLFAGIAGLAAWNDKASRIPFVSRLFFVSHYLSSRRYTYSLIVGYTDVGLYFNCLLVRRPIDVSLTDL